MVLIDMLLMMSCMHLEVDLHFYLYLLFLVVLQSSSTCGVTTVLYCALFLSNF